ncbi:MAG: hypothetical protein HY303_09950 [Candidatus Wallbacteria bacterium]|nr:hypothetical protein [Candidatus Wallbacteria bacterium]
MKREVAEDRLHPMRVKEELAARIVSTYHGEAGARRGAEQFARVHRKHEAPENMPTAALAELGEAPVWIVKLVTRLFGVSGNDARRQIAAGAVKVDGEKATDDKAEIAPRTGMVVQLGKHRFVRID